MYKDENMMNMYILVPIPYQIEKVGILHTRIHIQLMWEFRVKTWINLDNTYGNKFIFLPSS